MSYKRLKCYYAHFMGQYNTEIEHNDVSDLEFMGFDVINPNTIEHSQGCTEYRNKHNNNPMPYFYGLIKDCDILAYRRCANNTISAGVFGEIEYAKYNDKIIIELPSFDYTVLSVEETRNLLNVQTK